MHVNYEEKFKELEFHLNKIKHNHRYGKNRPTKKPSVKFLDLNTDI